MLYLTNPTEIDVYYLLISLGYATGPLYEVAKYLTYQNMATCLFKGLGYLYRNQNTNARPVYTLPYTYQNNDVQQCSIMFYPQGEQVRPDSTTYLLSEQMNFDRICWEISKYPFFLNFDVAHTIN